MLVVSAVQSCVGSVGRDVFFSSSSSCRAEAFALRALLSVRSDRRDRGHEDHEDEGTGLRRLQRARRRHQRAEAAAGLPLLQQAHGRPRVMMFWLTAFTSELWL